MSADQASPGPVTPEAVVGVGAVAVADVETIDGRQRGRPRASAGVPNRVGRYVILRPLGEGGMGVVFEAFDPELDRKVAIKLLQPSRVGSQASQRLLREAQVMARLSHPNVVAVHDAGVCDGRVFLAMELVRGRTVRAWLDAAPRGWREILAVFVDAGRGLAAAHACGIIHRDFKPENILIADEAGHARRVRVADFGLANYDPEVAALPRHAHAVALTATGAIVGTPVYMAPEQHGGLPLDAAADQFSFCVALHEALFGQRPFAGDSAIEIATNVCAGRYLAPASPGRAPRWLSNAVRRGLAVDPRARYGGFAELLAALQRDPVARLRRVATITSALAVTLLGGWALASRETPCEAARDRITAVWSDDARAGVRAVLAGAPQVGERTIATLDRYADGWADTHREMCTAHQRGEISGALLDGAMACLDRREAALARLVAVLGQGDPAVAEHAPLAAVALPAIPACSDRSVLGERVAPPADDASARAVGSLRQQLALAEVVHHAGDLERARTELATIAEQAAAIDYPPLAAELALVEGRLAIDRFEWEAARERLGAAAAIGVGVGRDAVAAEALARGLYVDAMLDDAPDRVLARESFVAGLVQRAGASPVLGALLANGVGVAHGQAGHPQSAAAAFARAVELATSTPDPNPVDLAAYRINLAIHTADPEERDAMFVRAARELSAALGDAHPKLVEIARQRAESTEDPQRAIELSTPVCAVLETHAAEDPLACNLCAWRLAELHDARGARDLAIVAARAADRCLAVVPDPGERGYADARRAATRGLVALLDGRPADARIELGVARDSLAPHAALPWIEVDLAGVALLDARALGELGRGAETRDALRAAIASFDRRLETRIDPAVRARRDAATRLLARIDAG